MKYARTAELLERSLRILEREHGEQDLKLLPKIEELANVLQADSKYPKQRNICGARLRFERRFRDRTASRWFRT